MSLAADLGGIFIVLDAATFGFTHILIIRETRPRETDWTLISSEEATGHANLFTFSHALTGSTRDEVLTRFRLAQAKNPD